MSEVERTDSIAPGSEGELLDQLVAELARIKSEIRDAEERLYLTLDAAGATGGWSGISRARY